MASGIELIARDMENPYQTGNYGAELASSGNISPRVIQALAGTRPWVRFCSIMGFIGSGFMMLAALAIMAGGAFGGMSDPALPAVGWLPMVMGVLYFLVALLYLIPSLKLWKYGTAILRLISSNSTTDLELAMEQQRGFWKFVGIMMLVMIGFSVLAMVGGVVAGVAGVNRVRQQTESPLK